VIRLKGSGNFLESQLRKAMNRAEEIVSGTIAPERFRERFANGRLHRVLRSGARSAP
jgi:hypothetical protein